MGRHADATRALKRAEGLLAGHPAIMHVRWDQGFLAVESDDPARARDCFQAALEHAWEVRYAKMVADALRALGYLASLSARRQDLRGALAHSVATLLAYPIYLSRPEGEQTVALCADLVDAFADDPAKAWRTIYRGELEDAAATGRPPFHYLRGLRTDGLDEVARVLDAIEARITRPNGHHGPAGAGSR
jgi:hypothetical protein